MGRLRYLLAVFALAACGSVKDSGTQIDAPMIDAAGPDADETGTAMVVTKGAVAGQMVGVAVGDIDLVSFRPNGTLLATGKTDAAGNATINVYPGGSVTALYRHPAPSMGADLITFVGVKPGETLEFGKRQLSGGQSTTIGSQTYSWPSHGSAGTYSIQTACNQAFISAPTLGTGSVPEFSSCNKTTMDVLYTVTTPSPQTLAACGFRSNVTFTNGQNVALGFWQNAVTAMANITGLPASITNVSTQFSTVIDGNVERFFAARSGAPSGGAFTGTFPWCTFGERTVAVLSMTRPGFNGTRVVDFLPASSTSWTVANPSIPPWVERTFFASAHTRELAWSFVPEGTPVADAVVADVAYNIRIDSTTTAIVNWDIILPPNTESFTLPELPTALAQFLPSSEFGMRINSVATYDFPNVADYDALRAMGAATATCPECAVREGEIQRVVVSTGSVPIFLP